jgi:hypothetical protein
VAHSIRTYSPILVTHAPSFFSSIMVHFVRTYSPIYSRTCPLIFRNHSGSFCSYLLAYSCRTCPLIFLKLCSSFYPSILTCSSRTCTLFIFSSIVAHSFRTYSPIVFIHAPSLFRDNSNTFLKRFNVDCHNNILSHNILTVTFDIFIHETS